MKRPSIAVIMTDTQACEMVGAYGHPECDTPALDALAAGAVRFDRAYTSCPLCTPARGAFFTGLHPQVNGAWANGMTPARGVATMGKLFGDAGYRTCYTGKWHLDGPHYMGTGVPDPDFEPDWWYDGVRYIEEVGAQRYARFKTARSRREAEDAELSAENVWGHRVADRALDFLSHVGDDPYLMVVSFDEPHGPFVRPAAFYEYLPPETMVQPPAFNAPLEGKPEMQRRQRAQFPCGAWKDYIRTRMRHFECNAYIDREIGRVVEAVRAHDPEAWIIYTADHGDMLGCHGLRSKGPMMYEQTVRVPLIVSGPDDVVAGGTAYGHPVSHLDVLPMCLELAGIDSERDLHGQSLLAALTEPAAQLHDHVMVDFNRFGIRHNSNGEYFPIRCLVGDRYKLAVNLHDTDELYDLQEDPHEMHNLIDDPSLSDVREDMLGALLAEMDRVTDPWRGPMWAERPWARPRPRRRYFNL